MIFDFDTRGGIRRVYAIPVKNILRIRNNWTNHTVTPELLNRDGIVEIPSYAGQNYSFREEHSITDQGDRYNVAITGVIPSNLISHDDIQTLRHGEWLVLHQDTRGSIRMSGTQLVPLRFTSITDKGSSHAELNGESFTFSAIESQPSPECYIADINCL